MNWFIDFDPKNFISRVNSSDIIKVYGVDNEFILNDFPYRCIYCGKTNPKGILLNDKSFLCLDCFEEISHITFPEKYEKKYREYLIQQRAYNIAKENILSKLDNSKIVNILNIILCFTFLTFLIKLYLVIIPAISLLLIILLKTRSKLLFNRWQEKFEVPQKPNLYHFNNPEAILTEKDKAIFKIFTNWPGYPPFWSQLKEIVGKRDKFHCQVNGCPSRVSLNIHHIKPKSKGGKHIPENLTTLCSFHHSLEPFQGHERIWYHIKNQYFTMVRSHYKRNPVNPGYHLVKAHVRRLTLVDQNELEAINNYYLFSCPICNSHNLVFNVYDREVKVSCINCKKYWVGDRKLAEEVGPKLAEILTVNKNHGNWFANWKGLKDRTLSFKSIH